MTIELYDAIVFIGRFQPTHVAHQEMFMRALKMGKRLIVLVGSANQPRTVKNPWKWQERAEMIYSVIPEEHHDRVKVRPLPDKKPMDNQWAKQVQDVVASLTDSTNIAILGNKKDHTSYYLDMFPQWPLIEQHDIDTMHATDIRNAYFGNLKEFIVIGQQLPAGIYEYMQAFALRPEYDKLMEEWKFYDMYRSQWNAAPYAVNFVTTDAVVIQSGHILLVKRRAYPGKGLWALPGGFLNVNETILDGTIRELKEETKIDCPIPVLRGSTKRSHVFDEPDRSLRGRTITHASLFELKPGPLPKIKKARNPNDVEDDAEKAKWVPFTVFDKMEDQMFEDHYHIVQYMIANA